VNYWGFTPQRDVLSYSTIFLNFNSLLPMGLECTPKMIQLVKQQKYHRGIIWEKREEDIQEISNYP